MYVRRNVSSLVGHIDFRSSATVSLKNCTGLPLRTASLETILEPLDLDGDLATLFYLTSRWSLWM